MIRKDSQEGCHIYIMAAMKTKFICWHIFLLGQLCHCISPNSLSILVVPKRNTYFLNILLQGKNIIGYMYSFMKV